MLARNISVNQQYGPKIMALSKLGNDDMLRP
jgi:hypothetical protein